ncbi:MAG: bifunctional demethylmenaquinone methyltransferase/2-methoxy-6-polyprenyl-1,4-benzoquinol methylase UbiE [Bryobacteraceae bacterium]|nr:bifunctional demethylmenaquinone methyltransferase/2-methoxy-6-polyprenyl-1,4-benzoquinol methylase UbiE [Bryobacteraceae bacterium]MDW8379298.1 bifunctional demethylmenaquinone methyltransferase/2-methoxy-6-polyprenyl-1,4-benzoquinol methylase UbiE [Bryobacterales bacterium]
MKAAGTTPDGVQGEEQVARWVRDMFSQVAGRYDQLNHLLSFQLDRYWRFRTAQRVQQVLQRPDARVLDLCCGTGDLLVELEKRAGRPLMGSDFCHPMLLGARTKIDARRLRSLLFEADALRLPLADQSLDLLTVAFGVRNFANYRKGFEEMKRVLKPGGLAAILEFSQPRTPIFASLYAFYSRRVLPAVGGWISGSRSAYVYLPDSVRKFPDAEQLAMLLRECGFREVEFERLTFGIVALHLATA